MQPVIAHSQPSSSTLALAMKLLALLSLQPSIWQVAVCGSRALESKLSAVSTVQPALAPTS